MERKGQKIGTDKGKLYKRRLADARNAWRKMDLAQRVGFLEFIEAEHGVDDGAVLPPGWSIVDPGKRWTDGPVPDVCTACGRESLDCSLSPCPAVVEDRAS